MHMAFDHPIMGRWTSLYAVEGKAAAQLYALEKQALLLKCKDILTRVLQAQLTIEQRASFEQQLLLLERKIIQIGIKLLPGITPYAFERTWLENSYLTHSRILRHQKVHFFAVALQVIHTVGGSALEPLQALFTHFLSKAKRRSDFFERHYFFSYSNSRPIDALRISWLRNRQVSGKDVRLTIYETAKPKRHYALNDCYVPGQVFYDGPTDGPSLHATMICGVIAARCEWGANLQVGMAPDAQIEVVSEYSEFLHVSSRVINSSCLTAFYDNESRRLYAATLLHVLSDRKNPKLLVKSIGNGIHGRGVFLFEHPETANNYFFLRDSQLVKSIILVQNIIVKNDGYVALNPSSNLPGEVASSYCVSAPGSHILSTTVAESENFKQVSGTSFSAALVTSVLALLLEAFPALTAEQLKYCILEGASPIAFNRGASKLVTKAEFAVLPIEEQSRSREFFGRGLVNAETSFALAEALVNG